MAENRTFTLIGKFDDQITKKLKGVNDQLKSISKILPEFTKDAKNINKEFSKLSSNFEDAGKSATKSFSRMTSSLEDAGRAAGKVVDTVSKIGEGVKGLDGISESLGDAARAASRVEENVGDIGNAAGRANKQADDLVTTLLKANSLVKVGDAMAQGFDRGMGAITGSARKGAGVVAKLFKDSMDDELSDIKAASGMQGSFGLAGYKGSFKDSQKMYKKYDQVVSEMIRQSSAPTAKVVELQRYTLDTMGPLMLAAQGVKKGTEMKDIDPNKITASAKQYGAFLEKAALFSQGTGSAGFRVAAGIEGLVTRGKIDTTIDFFTDNIMLMKNLENAGFAGRGMKSSKLMNATDAQRMAAMMEAFNKSMSGESTKAMASSLTGALQGLNDTIFNPSVGILGMSVTFSEEEQKKANSAINRIQNARIVAYQKELKGVKTTEKRKEQLRINIEQAALTRDQLTKDGADEISTPFKAFSFAFSRLIQSLTSALNAIGPVWTQLSLSLIDVTDKLFGPLAETLNNVASNMRAGDVTQAQGFGRIVGEIFKTFGKMLGDLATMLTSPEGAMGKVQSEFLQGFMEAFKKEPGSFEKAKKGISDGIDALIKKLFEVLMSIITSETIRPLVVPLIAAMFGPSVISAVIAGITPLILTKSLGFIGALFARANVIAATTPVPKTALTPKLSAAQRFVGAPPLVPVPPVPPPPAAGPLAKVGAVASKLAGPAALIAGFIAFDTQILDFAQGLKDFGTKLQDSKNFAAAGFSTLVSGLGTLIEGLTNTFAGAFDFAVGLVTGDIEKIKAGFVRMMNGITQAIGGLVVSVIGIATTLGGTIIEAVRNLFTAIYEGVLGIKNESKPKVTKGSKSRWNAVTRKTEILTDNGWVPAAAAGSPGKQYSSLGGAVSSEMRNKPPGSNLVIANSSETVIPAAGGLGMDGLIQAIFGAAQSTASTITQGFTSLTQTTAQGDQSIFGAAQRTVSTITQGFTALNQTTAQGDQSIVSAQKQTAMQTQQTILRSTQAQVAGQQQLMAAIKAGGMGGMPGGALGSASVGGGVDAFTGMAASAGLQLTSGYRPGDPGWHGSNRARDYSNGTGPTPQMLQFAQALAAKYGSSLKELIYTPLGFSIKNGQRVAPYAQAAHYNHVHVAYAFGQGNPAFFSNQNAAQSFENKLIPSNVKSITTNTGELAGLFDGLRGKKPTPPKPGQKPTMGELGTGTGYKMLQRKLETERMMRELNQSNAGPTTINAPITIQQQPGQDANALAAIVVQKMSEWVSDARSSSIFV